MLSIAFRRAVLSSSRKQTSFAGLVPAFHAVNPRFIPQNLQNSIRSFTTPSAFQPTASRQDDFPKYHESDGGAERRNFRQPKKPSNTIYLGNLPYNVEEGELQDLFAKFGDIRAVRIGMSADGQSRGFAHIEFSDVSEAQAAMDASEAEPFYIIDRELRLDFADVRAPGAPSDKYANLPPNHKLYISNWPRGTQEIRDAMHQFEAGIVSVHMLRDVKTGKQIGSGFIDFVTVDRATEALEALNGQEVDGVRISLSYAKPQREPRNRSHGGEWQDNGGNRGRDGGDYGARRGGGRGGGYGGARRDGGGRDGGNREGRRQGGGGGGGGGGGRYSEPREENTW